ncbi:hypothetical protein [Aureispira anguillae]|uniref:Uncharacterized protein n=1 Tax=Aureispira anguillae TaxID=2864201 RepID=A0A915YIN8_9BACT|nr:hypothetical protein [Aureispira anguillae]BDS13681.1 hypothetical protein AsAng_0044220 [Aureispira anguillae]
MNKQKIIAIYQEMLASIHKIKNSGQPLTEGQKIQLTQLETIANQLKSKAEAAGFGEELVADPTIAVNSADDLFQLIDTSVCSADIRQKLATVVGKNYVADGLSRKKLWDALQIFDKYYIANVDKISAVTVNSRMKGEWEKIFGTDKYDLQLLATAYQNSAKEALLKEIDRLSPNNWVTKPANLDQSFKAFFKGKKSWLDSANDIAYAATQLKIDAYEFPLIPDRFDTKYFKFTNGKTQVSGKLAFGSPVLINNQEKAINGFLVDFEQAFRSTVNLKAFKGVMPSIGGVSGTALTKGATLDLGYVTFTLKTDLAKYGLQPTKKDVDEPTDNFFRKIANRGKFTAASVRFQGTINLAKLIKKTGLELPLIDVPVCNISVSCGFDVSLVPIKPKVKNNSSKQKTPDADLDRPSIENDQKALKKIQAKNDDLLKRADQLSDAIDKQDVDAMKKAANEVQETAKDAYKLLENHDWKDKSLKNKAADLLDQSAKKVYKKIAGPVAKITKALNYAKPLARLMPAVNAVLTIIEVGTYIYDFAVWFNSIEANTWEDYFIAWGKDMSQGTFGQWFRKVDTYLKQ